MTIWRVVANYVLPIPLLLFLLLSLPLPKNVRQGIILFVQVGGRGAGAQGGMYCQRAHYSCMANGRDAATTAAAAGLPPRAF